jgi:hypothetical protein
MFGNPSSNLAVICSTLIGFLDLSVKIVEPTTSSELATFLELFNPSEILSCLLGFIDPTKIFL